MGVFLFSCEDEILPSMPRVEGGTRYEWPAGCNSYVLQIEAEGEWEIESHASWVFISPVKGTGSTAVSLYVEENADDESRSGFFEIYASNHPSVRTKIEMIQQDKQASGDNGLLLSELPKNYGVGWGYNVFGEYASESGIKKQVLNYAKIREQEKRLNEEFTSDQPQYKLEYRKVTAHSVEEYSRNIHSESKSSLNLFVYKREITKRFDTDIFVKQDRSLSTLSMLNIVAQRYVSEAGIKALLAQKADILTDDFKNAVERLGTSPSSKQLEGFLNEFGTHVVITAYLGGRLDYSLSIETTRTTQIETCVTVTYENIFGKKKTHSESDRKILESLSGNYDCNCVAKGGEVAALQADIRNKISKKEAIDGAIFEKWEKSFNDAESMLASRKAAMIDTELIPIYDLISDKGLKSKIQEAIGTMATLPENSFTADGIEAYLVDLDALPADVCIAYNKAGQPVAEIAREYLPFMRTDKKVTVIYPVNPENGRTDYINGFFVGDGEGHAPGQITWESNHSFNYTYLKNGLYAPNEKCSKVYLFKEYVYGKKEYYFTPLVNTRIAKIDLPYYPVKIGPYYWGVLFSNTLLDVEALGVTPDLTYEKEMNELYRFLGYNMSPLFDNAKIQFDLPGRNVKLSLNEWRAGNEVRTLNLYPNGVYALTNPGKKPAASQRDGALIRINTIHLKKVNQ